MNALPIYTDHPGRPPVAMPENAECSSAILLLVVSLESHVNRLMYFNAAGLTTEASLLQKLETYLPEEEHLLLRTYMSEVTVCRDAVTHALLWEEQREHDDKWRLQKVSWQLAPVTALRQKVTANVAEGAITSKMLGMNVVPTNVDFVDAAKALIVVCRVMRALESKFGNPKAWVGMLPAEMKLQTIFPVAAERDDHEAWIEAVVRRLHPCRQEDLRRRLGIEILQDGEVTGVSKLSS